MNLSPQPANDAADLTEPQHCPPTRQNPCAQVLAGWSQIWGPLQGATMPKAWLVKSTQNELWLQEVRNMAAHYRLGITAQFGHFPAAIARDKLRGIFSS
jgi:hypothetical protein